MTKVRGLLLSPIVTYRGQNNIVLPGHTITSIAPHGDDNRNIKALQQQYSNSTEPRDDDNNDDDLIVVLGDVLLLRVMHCLCVSVGRSVDRRTTDRAGDRCFWVHHYSMAYRSLGGVDWQRVLWFSLFID